MAQVVNLAAICNPSEYIKQPVNTINSNFTDAQDCINFCVELNKHLCAVPREVSSRLPRLRTDA